MAREVNPNREKAKQSYIENGGNITNRRIAEILGEDEKKIAVWKQRDNWVGKSGASGNVVQQKKKSKKNVVQQKKAGAPKGSKNAKGNRGGSAPEKNDNAVTHGFFRKIFPDDPETMDIIETIRLKSPLDILWDQIVIQYTAIARAQKIMFVQDKNDITEHLKKTKVQNDSVKIGKGESATFNTYESYREEEWEFQFAWDKQANFLQAQSRAMATLQSLIGKYEDLLLKDLATEEQKMRIAKLKAEVAKISNTGTEETEDWVSALQQVATKRREQVNSSE